MRRVRWYILALLGIAALVLIPARRPTRPHIESMTTHSAILKPRPVAPPEALRWLDVLGTPYAEAFRCDDFYEGPDGPQVQIRWGAAGQTFAGDLVASGLKPNFAYQMVLMGRVALPPRGAGSDARAALEAETSRQLGHWGRWWCEGCGCNVTDAGLSRHLAHGVRGYLLFDYFLTDLRGSASKPFSLDSSYHVLWRTSQRQARQQDGRPESHQVTRGAVGYGLRVDEPGGMAEIFAERETARPRPGELRLPAGDYQATFVLVEESFHDNDRAPVPLGGFWARVLQAPVEFTIDEAPVSRTSIAAGARDRLRRLRHRLLAR